MTGKTKLQRHYFGTRLVSVSVNYTLLFAILTLIFGMLPILSILIVAAYFFLAVVLSLFLIIATLFLVLLNTNDPDNPLHQIWAKLGPDAQQQMIQDFVNFSKVATPIMFAITMVFCITMLVLVNKRMGRSSLAKDRAILIVSIILSCIGMGLGLITIFAK